MAQSWPWDSQIAVKKKNKKNKKNEADCIISLLEEASYQLILVCSILYFVILPQEEIALT